MTVDDLVLSVDKSTLRRVLKENIPSLAKVAMLYRDGLFSGEARNQTYISVSGEIEGSYDFSLGWGERGVREFDRKRMPQIVFRRGDTVTKMQYDLFRENYPNPQEIRVHDPSLDEEFYWTSRCSSFRDEIVVKERGRLARETANLIGDFIMASVQRVAEKKYALARENFGKVNSLFTL